MKIFKTLAAVLLLLVGATACDNNDTPEYDPVVSLTLNSSVSFTSAKELATGTWAVFDAPVYEFKINTSTLNAGLRVEKLTYAEGKSVSFTLDNLLLTVDPENNAWTLTNRNPMVVRDDAGNSHDITGFSAYIFISGRAPEIVRIEFTLDNSHKIRAIMKYNAFKGKSVVTSAKPGAEPYENESTIYFLILNHKTQKARILLYDAKFASAMPGTLDMDFLSQPFTVDDNGVSFNVPERFDPMNNNVPYEKYAITNLNLVMDPCRTLDGGFTCGGAYNVAIDTESAVAIDSKVLNKMTAAMGKY